MPLGEPRWISVGGGPPRVRLPPERQVFAMTEYRTETDSMGAVEVPANRYWGAQTQRSIRHFSIGWPEADRIPVEIVRALGVVKKAAALTNVETGKLEPDLGRSIVAAAEEVIDGRLDDHFPLYVGRRVQARTRT